MLKLEIVTPEKRVVDETVDSVIVPTLTGEAGILPNHVPLVSALRPGVLSFSVKGTTEKFAVAGGFVEVRSDTVSVLTDVAEKAGDFDIAFARSEKEAAEKALAAVGSSSIDETTELRERLDLAAARIQLLDSR